MGFIYSQLFIKPPYPTTDFTSQTIIVTGANVGLGLEAARHFVRLNAAKVILGVRSAGKGQAAKSSIESSTRRTDVVEVWPLDLSSYASVAAFADRASTSLPRLDAVVENAAVVNAKYATAEDNESTITVNVVSTVLLAILLLPALRKSARQFHTVPRLSIVTSEVHGWTPMPEWKADNTFAALNDRATANMAERYQSSKLLVVLAVRQLAALMTQKDDDDVVVLNMLNPGLCHSALGRNVGWDLWLLKLFLARSTEVGSRTLVHAAAAGRETHGKYLSDATIADAEGLSAFVRSEDGAKAQEKVWRELSEKLERIRPGIMGTI